MAAQTFALIFLAPPGLIATASQSQFLNCVGVIFAAVAPTRTHSLLQEPHMARRNELANWKGVD
jgi:hypothetical protein